MKKVIKLGKLTGCTRGMDNESNKYTHLPSNTNYATLCGLGEEEYETVEEIKGKLTCPDCITIVKIVKEYL